MVRRICATKLFSLDVNGNLVLNARSSPYQLHNLFALAIGSCLLLLAKALNIFHIVGRKVPKIKPKVSRLSPIERMDVVDEFATMCVGFGRRRIELL